LKSLTVGVVGHSSQENHYCDHSKQSNHTGQTQSAYEAKTISKKHYTTRSKKPEL
jgi:hypothetical protein